MSPTIPREMTLAPEKGSRLPTAWTLSSSSRKSATCSPPTSAHTPVLGTMSSRRQILCNFNFPLRRAGGTDLAALGDEDDVAIGLVAVDKMAEPLPPLRVGDPPLPLALVAVDQLLDVRLELGADAQRVLAHHLTHVVDAALQVLQPHAGALQPVAGADVEHEEAVDVLNQFLFIQILCKQISVSRLHAAVAAHVQVPAFFRGDDADVLALRLGALARAARDRHLHLVRRADAAVAVLDVDRHRDRILDSVTAPGAADTGLYCSQCFPIGVARFEARVHEILPDERQLLDARAEEVDALRAGDLGVEAEFLRHDPEHDQFLGCDLAARNPRHDRIGAVLLQVGEEVVVRVLQRRVRGLEDHLVPARGENRGEGRLADVAAATVAVPGDDGVEAHELADPDKMEHLLARIVEVLA